MLKKASLQWRLRWMALLATPTLFSKLVVEILASLFITERNITEQLNDHDSTRKYFSFIYLLPVVVGICGDLNVRDPPDFDLVEKRHHFGEELIEVIWQALRSQSGEKIVSQRVAARFHAIESLHIGVRDGAHPLQPIDAGVDRALVSSEDIGRVLRFDLVSGIIEA
jgi:hypothetical protein